MTVAPPLPQLARYRDEFPVFRHTRYLNSCSLGALSGRTRAAHAEYLDQWERRGAAAWYDTWLPAIERLRDGYARVMGAMPEDVSLHSSISSALSVVAESLDYRLRPKVVTTSLDFPTIAYQWLAKASRGVEVEIVESPDGTIVPLERLAEAIDGRTALVATSTSSSRAVRFRTSPHSPRSRALTGRCCWWTATRRLVSCPWTSRRWAWTSIVLAG